MNSYGNSFINLIIVTGQGQSHTGRSERQDPEEILLDPCNIYMYIPLSY